MKLSIIVAVYNTSKYLRQCLDSVFNQTLSDEDYEVIIVNDCSTDNSMEIINEMADGRSNVRIIDKQINEATFWSRVDGIVAAKGDYVGFVDSDDWCELDMYERMLNEGIAARADIVECGTIYEYPDGIQRHMTDERVTKLIPAIEMVEGYATHPMQLAMYLRIFSRKIMDDFVTDMLPYFDARREEYRGIRNEDDLLLPLFFSRAENILYMKERFCHHRMEIEGSTMDIIRKNPKKYLDACVYRVNAGFDVMRFTKENKPVYQLYEHKQINVIFGLLGKLLETDFYSREEGAKLLKDAVSQFDKEKKWLILKDKCRLLHLKLKVFRCYGR